MFTLFASQALVELAIASGVAAVVSKDQAATYLLAQARSLLKSRSNWIDDGISA
jgi:hypothetical protein